MEEKAKIITQQDIKFILAIIIFLMPIFAGYYNIEKRLSLIEQKLEVIKSNDLSHVQASLSAMKARNDVQDQRTIQLGLDVERILTTLDLKK